MIMVSETYYRMKVIKISVQGSSDQDAVYEMKQGGNYKT